MKIQFNIDESHPHRKSENHIYTILRTIGSDTRVFVCVCVQQWKHITHIIHILHTTVLLIFGLFTYISFCVSEFFFRPHHFLITHTVVDIWLFMVLWATCKKGSLKWMYYSQVHGYLDLHTKIILRPALFTNFYREEEREGWRRGMSLTHTHTHGVTSNEVLLSFSALDFLLCGISMCNRKHACIHV